ncbi:MAG TPA: metal-dependent hydrolase [Polyangiaceae bacterium]|nr:metal-dependent hydrolase [Polyangiaceae bacterium]
MSSFAGHALAAATAFALAPRPRARRDRALWLGWLVALALAPDLDYLIRALDRGPDRRLRVTHSLALAALLPALTAAALWAAGVRGRALARRGAQALGAGLSHLALDLLVGVTALPLLWPASDRRFRLPFGLLPSAGRLELRNPLLYRNLLLELGALGPLSVALALALGPGRPARPRGALIAGLLAVSAAFMAASTALHR